jgi:hypothetical protein
MPATQSTLSKAALTGVFSMALLLVAGVRHNYFWGGSLYWVMHGFETLCLLGFTWFGALSWLRGMAAVREESPGLRRLLLLSLPILAVAVLVPNFLSQDVVDYVMRGRILSLHGGNPYVQMAADFPEDPFVAFGDAGWKQFPLPYGPLIADLQGLVAWIAHQFSFLPVRAEMLLACALFKTIFAGSLILSALTARSICAVLRPADQDVIFLGVLWNPLLLNEGVAQAHNEPLMLLALLVAVRAMLVGRVAVGTFALGMGVLIKIIPVLVAPIVLVSAARQRRLTALLMGGFGAMVVLAFYYWRFFTEPDSLDFIRRQSGVTGVTPVSFAAALFDVDIATALTGGRIVTVIVILAAAVHLWRRPEPRVFVVVCAACLAAMVCFGLGGFRSWYHIWWIPLALLAGHGFLYRFAWWATMLSPLGYLAWVSMRSYDSPHGILELSAGMLLPALLAACWRQRPGPGS